MRTAWRSDVGHVLDNMLGEYDFIGISVLEIKVENNRRDTVDGGESVEQCPNVAAGGESLRPGSMPDVPEGIDMSRSSLMTLISLLDQEIKLLAPSATSEVALFYFNSGADGIFESTSHESKIQPHYKRHSRHFESLPPVSDLPSPRAARASCTSSPTRTLPC